MDRALLEGPLGEGLSLAEIGRRVGKHESTVAYWARKYGLRAVHESRHAPKGGLDRQELERLVGEGKSLSEIAHVLSRSKATVRYWLERYQLRTTGKQGAAAREGVHAARAAGLVRARLRCPAHGVIEHVRDRRGYYRCSICRQEAVIRRRRKVKKLLVEEFGGQCQLCGYKKCLAALEFHHLDPSTKAFNLARRGAHSIERLRAEARKCALLCSNCHVEVETGLATLGRDDAPAYNAR
jgi:transposase